MMQKRALEIKIQSPDKKILGHLNINSVRNKFRHLHTLLTMKGFSVPFRYDRNAKAMDFFCTFANIYNLNY